LGVSSWAQLKLVLRESSRDGTLFNDVQLRNVKISDLKASDFIFSTSGAKTLIGSDWKDTLFGSAFADRLCGGYGDDVLLGGDGNDLLIGGHDVNDLYGQGGADIFKMSVRLTDAQSGSFGVSQSDDRIRDFKIGVDKVDVSTFGISSFDQLKIILETKAAGAFFDAYYAGRNHTVSLDGIALKNLTAADFIFSTRGAKNVSGSDVEDTLFGSLENDTLNGGSGSDLLVGGAGDDVVIGGRGENELYGQGGRDTFKASARSDYQTRLDTVHDFEIGVDKIDVSAYGISSFDQLEFLLLTQNGTDTYIDALYGSNGSGFLLKNVDADKLKSADFVFDTRASRNENGTGDDDYLFGSRGADVLNGRHGNDQVFGGYGDDRLMGDDGEDALLGQRGNDRLYGQNGNDLLDGGYGDDLLMGGTERMCCSANTVTIVSMARMETICCAVASAPMNSTAAQGKIPSCLHRCRIPDCLRQAEILSTIFQVLAAISSISRT
jgi:Ca2+-binding RTX toxin-like protein